MSQNIYSLVERRKYAQEAEELQLTVPALWTVGGNISDFLRTALPDMDDVTIGRVMITLAEFVTAGIRMGAEIPNVNLVAGLLASGLQMTEPEWKDEAP